MESHKLAKYSISFDNIQVWILVQVVFMVNKIQKATYGIKLGSKDSAKVQTFILPFSFKLQ